MRHHPTQPATVAALVLAALALLAPALSAANNVSHAGVGLLPSLVIQATQNPASLTREKTATNAFIQGDIVIGGLFPVHEKESEGSGCGLVQADRGIQRLEAMLFTIDHINRDRTVLKGVRLGAKILDTCSRDTYALEQSLEYVRASLSSLDAGEYQCADGSQAAPISSPVPVAGIIGGAYSSVSIQVANLLRLFKIPQISYASTSAALSDKTRFDYFARTVPPDNYQAKAMADIVQNFNWSYVSTVASEGDYGEMGIDSFQSEARARNICIALSLKVPQSSNYVAFDSVITRLMEKMTARVVVLFLRVEDARDLLLAAKRQNMTDHFVWIASDGWGKNEMPVKDNAMVAGGAITLELQSIVIAEFDDYFKNLKPATNVRNPWFHEYWESVHDCHFLELPGASNATAGEGRSSGSSSGANNHNNNNHKYRRSDPSRAATKICSGNERITPKIYTQESKIQFVFDAVYALAYALDALFLDKCGHFRGRKKRRNCIKQLQIEGDVLYSKYLLNVSFLDHYGTPVEFDKNGDSIGRYNIMNYRRNRSTGKFEYVTVGKWTEGLTLARNETVMWPGGTYNVPTSHCSLPCGEGQIKRLHEGDACCWVCTTCAPNQKVLNELACQDCPVGWWPTDDKRDCFKLEEHYMRWDSVFAIVPSCLSILGIVLTGTIIAAFVKNIDTPIVKASGRELSFMLLSGFIICYLMTFVLIAKPSPVMCGLQRFGIGFGFSVTYASLLTKTNRISRIFDSASRSAKRPPFISPKSQVVITLIFIGVQVVCTCIWLILEPPGVRHFHPFGKKEEIVLKCSIRDESFLISLVYNMILIIICTVYAVKTRKIPENFNESKFIGFTMYTTCIIWLAFIPIYFGTLNSFQIQITTLCISISLSAFVALLCLFTPKMYIIVFQPEKNVRKLTMNSATYKKSITSSLSGEAHRNNGPQQEHIRLNCPNSPNRMHGTTETETDKDSMASL